MIRFLPKVAEHCLDYVPRIAKELYLARLLQISETDRRSGDLGLLVRRIAEVFANRAPKTLEPKYRDGSRARLTPAVAKTRTVADDGYLLHAILFRVTSCVSCVSGFGFLGLERRDTRHNTTVWPPGPQISDAWAPAASSGFISPRSTVTTLST